MQHAWLGMALFVGSLTMVGLAAYADDAQQVFLDNASMLLNALKTTKTQCGAYVASDAGLWCVGANGHNLYQWNDTTQVLDYLCDGGLDQLMLLPDGTPAARSAGEGANPTLWWTPMQNPAVAGGQCKAVTVTVQ